MSVLEDQIVNGLRPYVECPIYDNNNRSVRPNIPDKFISLIQRCVEANPNKRPSFDDIVQELSEEFQLKPPTPLPQKERKPLRLPTVSITPGKKMSFDESK